MFEIVVLHSGAWQFFACLDEINDQMGYVCEYFYAQSGEFAIYKCLLADLKIQTCLCAFDG